MARYAKPLENSARNALVRGDRVRRRSLPINRFVFDVLEHRQLLATITVNTASDSTSVATALSLRQAIEISNGTLLLSSLTGTQQGLVNGALSSPNTIDFNIPGSSGQIFDIALTSALPAITRPVILNGYSQPGASANTNGPGQGDNAVLDIELDGTSAGSGADGLVVSAGSSTIEGLVIANFGSQNDGRGGNGIVLQTAGGDLVAGNFIGTNPTGSVAQNIAGDDVLIESGSSGNTVGGLTPGARDLFVNNNAGGSSGGAGVDIEGTSANLVLGNLIGTDATGTKALAAGTDSLGILIAAGATNNTVGGTTASAGNLISGNSGSGVQIGATTDTVATSGNVVAGNRIGTDVTGLLALGNGFGSTPRGDGVDLIGTNSIDNTVGGTGASAGNLISGNAYDGIFLDNAGHDTLAFNLVGADVVQNYSNTAMGNTDLGIELDNAPTNTISRNIVVNNLTGGVGLFDPLTTAALISNNEIILNNGNGIVFCSCGDGGSAIYGNLIGTNASGTLKLGNKGDGIDIGSPNNTVGGTASGDANVIAFNTKAGIGLENLNTDTHNTLSVNSIYSNKTLGIDLGDRGFPLPNVAGGWEAGPNDLLNFPVLTVAAASNANTMITGSLTGAPNQTFTIQFFSNATADPTGYGQGQTFVGLTTTRTNSSGTATFTFFAAGNLGGQMLSATATDASGNTSEFAKSIKVSPAPPGNTLVGTTTSLAVNTATVAAGQAITLAAKVSAVDGSVPTGDVIFLVNGQAVGQPVPLEVVNGLDVATLTTTLSAPGTDSLVAQYAGDSVHSASSSNSLSAVVQPIVEPDPQPTMTGPAVVSVEWVGNHSASSTIVIQFDQALDPGSAQAASNFTILTGGQRGQFGIGSKHILLKSAVYNAASHTVTLHTSRSLKVGQRYQLTLVGASPRGLASAGGIMLDAASPGSHGSNFITTLNQQNYVVNIPGPTAKVRARRDAIRHRHGA
jgi:Bacterial Ig-like domain (group 3)/Right handed beta helix region/Bacterial Ig-like domain